MFQFEPNQIVPLERVALLTRRAARKRPVPRLGETILIADDDEATRGLAVAILRRQGYAVCVAEDGAAALAVLRQRPVDLLIAAARMPFFTGRELACRAQRLWPQVPILFVADSFTGADFDCAALGGPKGFLSKPFSFVGLLDHVEDLLARRGTAPRPLGAVG
jgi:two-component system response regulator PrrA